MRKGDIQNVMKFNSIQQRWNNREFLDSYCARGFKEYVPYLIIVTNDLSSWDNVNERNQCFIDGALFASTLIYALHSNNF